MTHSSTVPLGPASHHFVEQYPDLVYAQFRDGQLLPGGQQLHFDFLKPRSSTPTPLVVFIKGGGFRNVHRTRYLPALVPLAERGIAVASVEYRTSNLARFPAPVDDVRGALRYLRSHAAQFNLDPTAVALWGNSAGATIATITGASAPDEAEPVRAVASWYGIHDPLRSPGFREPGSPLLTALGPVEQWFTPSDHIRSDSPPMFLLHGTADTTVPVEQSISLAETLTELGVPHELMLVEGGHHDFSEMCTRTDALRRTYDFLQQHLR